MHMLNGIVMSLLLALVLSACASQEVAAPCKPTKVEEARLPPNDPAIMVPRTPNFRERLRQILPDSPTTPTTSSASSPPPSSGSSSTRPIADR